MIKCRKESDEVLYPIDDFVTSSAQDLKEMIKMAELNPRQRIRLCAHKTPDDIVHEMIIFHPANTYVHPHKHVGKEESFHLISGVIDLVTFDEGGKIKNVLKMGSYESGKPFYYRIPANTYHTQIFHKDTLFHEVAKGPFNRKANVAADWAPDEKDVAKVSAFIGNLKNVTFNVN